VKTARIRSEDGRIYLRLDHDEFPVEVGVASESDAEALIAAMRLDPRSVTAPYSFIVGSRRRFLIRMAAQFGVLGIQLLLLLKLPPLFPDCVPVTIVAILAPVPLMVLLWAILGMGVAQIAVGSDGLRITHDFIRTRFVPYAAVKDVAVADGVLELHFDDHTKMTMTFGGRRRTRYLLGIPSDAHGEVARAFAERVRGHLARHGTQDAQPSAAVLGRGGRSTTDWLHALTLLRNELALYRTAALPAETALPSERAGAAAVLAGGLETPDRWRLRVIAETCAESNLRVALEAAATSPHIHYLRGALDRIDDTVSVRRGF
jgi:hypothetical protein